MKNIQQLEHVDQSAQSIRYALLSGALEMNQFSVMLKKTIKWQNATVNIHILAESHLVSVENNTEILHEVCACTEIDSGLSTELTNTMLVDMKNTLIKTTNEFLYTFHSAYMSLSQNSTFIEEMTKRASRHTQKKSATVLMHTFASDNNQTESPVTLVHVEAGEFLRIRSIHTYPNEDTFVLTDSVWSFRNGELF